MDALFQKFDELGSKFNKQMGIRDHFISEKARLFTEIEELNKFLDSESDVQEILHELQSKTQSKTKGIYEELLTKLIRDIMPDNDECDRVILKTGVKGGRTTLNVEVANKKGFTRDVYLDKGGSIENIIAMGLRFIALSRASNRRFLILDEADSWLKDIYIPSFAEVLCQLSRSVGIQVVYISHHDVDNFAGKAKIVNLTRENGKIIAEDKTDDHEGIFEGIEDENLSDLMEDVGIKYLRLVNVKQHENTLIELSPNVTIITGDNDIGKTTILQAIEAVNHNLGRDGLIRDNQPYCRVEFGIEDNITLSWSYKRKGQKRTSYNLIDEDGSVLKESDSGKDSPDWLHDYLAMGLFKDFDLHIGDQHNASFILDKKISSHKRSEILSLGKEASKVQKMIALHGEKVTKSKRELRAKQKEINDVKNKLAIMRNLDEKIDSLNKTGLDLKSCIAIENELKDIKSSADLIKKLSESKKVLSPIEKAKNVSSLKIEEELKQMEIVLNRLESLSERKIVLSNINSVKDIKIENIEDFSGIQNYLNEILRLLNIKEKLSQFDKIKELTGIEVEMLDDILLKGKKISNLEKSLLASSKAIDLSISEKNKIDHDSDPSEISDLGRKIKALKDKQKEIELNIENAKAEEIKSNKELQEFIDSIGGVCPTCNNQFSLNHQHN